MRGCLELGFCHWRAEQWDVDGSAELLEKGSSEGLF